MGNNAGKDGHGSAGSPLDFFQTAPTTPSSVIASSRASSASGATPETAACTTPFTPTSPPPDWALRPSPPSEWAVISQDGITSAHTNASGSPGTTTALSLDHRPRGEPTSSRSPSEHSWQERDSGLEPQAIAERASEEMTLVLLSLMEHYQNSLGLAHNTDLTSGAVELLRHLITERDELSQEVQRLRETLRSEREDWRQFQCDLQVAVSVADRLRMESEESVESLLDRCNALERQLGQALTREQAKGRELRELKDDHKVACRKLLELTLEKQQAARRTRHYGNEILRQDSRGSQEMDAKKSAEETFALQDGEAVQNPDDPNERGRALTGKGVAECYLRSIAALEKKRERTNVLRDSRRVVMLSERSWSLSRLPLPAMPSTDESNTSTTLPLCKKEESKGRMERALQRQDSWSSFYTVKQDEDTDYFKPQDGFSALLRRHGGSRRNSLLCWCQERTQGYENIDITNFSSSWEDGLAFCALYHTYLPGAIAFEDLKAENKSENLNLAFVTGETLGITATLTVEDMLKADGPDWQSVLAYVENVFRHFEM